MIRQAGFKFTNSQQFNFYWCLFHVELFVYFPTNEIQYEHWNNFAVAGIEIKNGINSLIVSKCFWQVLSIKSNIHSGFWCKKLRCGRLVIGWHAGAEACQPISNPLLLDFSEIKKLWIIGFGANWQGDGTSPTVFADIWQWMFVIRLNSVLAYHLTMINQYQNILVNW